MFAVLETSMSGGLGRRVKLKSPLGTWHFECPEQSCVSFPPISWRRWSGNFVASFLGTGVNAGLKISSSSKSSSLLPSWVSIFLYLQSFRSPASFWWTDSDALPHSSFFRWIQNRIQSLHLLLHLQNYSVLEQLPYFINALLLSYCWIFFCLSNY